MRWVKNNCDCEKEFPTERSYKAHLLFEHGKFISEEINLDWIKNSIIYIRSKELPEIRSSLKSIGHRNMLDIARMKLGDWKFEIEYQFAYPGAAWEEQIFETEGEVSCQGGHAK